jgi:hypothetical protein
MGSRSTTRKTSKAERMLDDFSGALMTDGYTVYDSACKTKQLENLGCWAHARRYFKEAHDAQGENKAGKANNVEPSVYLREVFTRLPGATCVEDVETL